MIIEAIIVVRRARKVMALPAPSCCQRPRIGCDLWVLLVKVSCPCAHLL